MRTRTYQRDVRALALLGELQAAGVPVLTVAPGPGPTVVVALDDAALDATVDQVVAAHDPAALDAAAQALAQQDAGDLAGFRSVYAALLADAATLEDTTVALTTQQLRNRLAALERVVARLARYAGRRLG
jgi:hypothetical protein